MLLINSSTCLFCYSSHHRSSRASSHPFRSRAYELAGKSISTVEDIGQHVQQVHHLLLVDLVAVGFSSA
eukprot:3409600-Heterocapsa_arctica.AAC.1